MTTLRNLGRALATHLRAGLRWWLGELAGLIPEKLRRSLSAVDSRLVLVVAEADGFEIAYEAGARRRILAQIGSAADLPPNLEDLIEIIKPWQRRAAMTCVRIAAMRALRTVANLPLAAERNLAQVLSFELDRQTPFKTEDACFTYRTLERNTAARRLAVELTVLPRAFIDETLHFAARLGIVPDSVEVANPRGGRSHLLSGGRLSRSQRVSRVTFAVLVAALLVLAAASVAIPLYQAHRTADRLAQELAVAKKQADAALRLQKDIDAQIQDGQSLVTRKRLAPSVSRILYAVTRALPDDTWLSELQISGNDVQMTGAAASASDLISRLDQSTSFANAAFRSTVTQDTKLNKEQFSISVNAMREAER